MPRPSIDDVITSVHEGVFETPYWTTFLNSIRRITNADYASLVLRRADARLMDIHLVKSGSDSRAEGNHNIEALLRKTALPYETLLANAPYTLDEIVDIDDPLNRDYLDYLAARRIHDATVIRVTEPGGGNAWLTVGSSGAQFSVETRSILARIAPHLSLAARTLAALEWERLRADVATDAVRRLNFGWITFDVSGRIVGIDSGAERLLQQAPALGECVPGQLFPKPGAARRELAECLAAFSEKSDSRSRPIHLLDDPWVDMLIVPIRYRAIYGGRTPIAVGYVHGVGAFSAERRDQLQQLFGLTKSEAHLAIAMSQGKSIAEAASEFNITTETARSYSKRIYAKTGTRGQADLVRIILASVIAMT